MNDHDFVVSPDFPRVKGEDIKIFGIIGNEILQYFNQFSIEKAYMFRKRSCGVAKVDNGYLPYGSGINFMPPNEEHEYIDRILGSNDKIVVGNDSDLCKTKNQNVTVFESSKIVKDDDLYDGETQIFYNSAIVTETANKGIETMQKESVSFTPHKKQKESVSFTPSKKLGKKRLVVNFAVNPVGYQFDPLQEIFLDPSVEYGLDNFYSLESIGRKEEDSLAYENDQVETFKKSISYKDGHYYVKLPWKADLIKQIPSNLKISLAVAERVYDKFEH